MKASVVALGPGGQGAGQWMCAAARRINLGQQIPRRTTVCHAAGSKRSHLTAHEYPGYFDTARRRWGRMSNLTIRLNPEEKARLKAWAAVRGVSTTDYIKALVAADMAAGNAHERAAAWFRENEAAIAEEAERVETSGVPGLHLALNHPWPDAEV